MITTHMLMRERNERHRASIRYARRSMLQSTLNRKLYDTKILKREYEYEYVDITEHERNTNGDTTREDLYPKSTCELFGTRRREIA